MITGTARRRRWSVVERLRVLEKSLSPGKEVSLVARRNGLA
ncbi:transposase [Consotaella salsifontis]